MNKKTDKLVKEEQTHTNIHEKETHQYDSCSSYITSKTDFTISFQITAEFTTLFRKSAKFTMSKRSYLQFNESHKRGDMKTHNSQLSVVDATTREHHGEVICHKLTTDTEWSQQQVEASMEQLLYEI